MIDPINPAAFAASGGRMGGRCSSSSSGSYSFGSTGRSSPFNSTSDPVDEPTAFEVAVFMSVVFCIFIAFGLIESISGGTSVLKLQVGLLGIGRSIQRDLNRIAEVADTSTSEGLSFVLTETTLALLRHPDCCISTNSSVDVKSNMDEGEKHFNQLSIEERGKFDEETFVNVNNVKRKSTACQKVTGSSSEHIVITILVDAKGVHKLPSINGSAALKEALQKLASIPKSKIQTVEVL